MLAKTTLKSLLHASVRDAKPTGQTPAPTRPPSGFLKRPVGHPAGAPEGARAAGGNVGRRDHLVRRGASDRPVTPGSR